MADAGSDPKPTPKRILVIDDVQELRDLVQSVLQDEGFSVEVAQDATLGALKLLSDKPDLVILDLNMPGVDGFRLVEYLKQFTAPPPFVVLSGNRTLESVLRGVKLGAFAFLPKPVDFTALVQTCRAALDKAAAAAQQAPRAEERRAHKRHALLVQVKVSVAGAEPRDSGKGYVLAELRDLSSGGARIISVARFPVGSRLELMADPRLIQAPALVAEVRTSEEVETGFRHGLKFVDLDPETERLLREHLAPKEP
jgi:CheY-like chemotaxis protein